MYVCNSMYVTLCSPITNYYNYVRYLHTDLRSTYPYMRYNLS